MFGLDTPLDKPAPEPEAEPEEEAMPAERLSRVEFMTQVDDLQEGDSSTRYAPDDREAAAQFALQNAAFRDQDTHLDHLSTSISRQHDLSLRMNEELELHTGLLTDLDRGVDDTELRLGGASNRLDRFRASMKEHGTWIR